MLEILKLHHLLETAQLLLSLSPSAEDSEEALRKGLHALLPENIANTLRLCLRSGRLQHALLIVQRCVRGALPLEPAEAVQRIPDDCSLEDFVAWVRQGVVERLSLFSAASPGVGALSVASELLKRAVAAEEATGSPFVAVRLVELAKDLTASIPFSISVGSKELVEQVNRLHDALVLQQALWERWDDEVRLEDVTSLSLQGLVFDRIDTTEEANLVEDLRTKVLPLITQFRGDSDALLRGWIEESISTRIVLAGEEAASGVDDGESCTLSRLVKVASVIEDRNVQAKMVLTLLQMPVLEEMSLRGGLPASSHGAEETEMLDATTAAKRQVGTNHLASTRLLCDLAAAASDFVDGATREALTEATRLLRIKSLAASYGIESFEPRNGKQVRSVVILIANTMHRPESIRDAVEFSSSWGNSSVDMKAVLTRAIILRSTNIALFVSEATKFESTLRSSLIYLPTDMKQIVCEDVVAFLLEELSDESDGIQYQPGQNGSAAVAKTKKRAEMLIRAAVAVCSHYLDTTRDQTETPEGGGAEAAAANKRIRSHEQLEGSINSDLLQLFKRILTLQTVHDIFLSHVDIGDSSICQAVVAQLASYRVKLLLKDVASLPDSDGTKLPRITAANAPLNTSSRKVCLLLNVLPTYFTHTAMKLLVEASQTVPPTLPPYLLFSVFIFRTALIIFPLNRTSPWSWRPR